MKCKRKTERLRIEREGASENQGRDMGVHGLLQGTDFLSPCPKKRKKGATSRRTRNVSLLGTKSKKSNTRPTLEASQLCFMLQYHCSIRLHFTEPSAVGRTLIFCTSGSDRHAHPPRDRKITSRKQERPDRAFPVNLPYSVVTAGENSNHSPHMHGVWLFCASSYLVR